MKKIILLSLLLFFVIPINAQKEYNKFSVLFGEHSLNLKESPENVIRVFIDKNGYYYPDIVIKDKALRKNKSALKNWYKANANLLQQLCETYNIESTLSIEKQIEALNNAIIADKVEEINTKLSQYEAVDILIHGFRKMAYGDNGKYSSYSTSDNSRLRRRLSVGRSDRLFIEIYWDSKFIKGAFNVAIGRKPFKLFEQSAIPNAKRVGEGLRKLVSQIEGEKINIFCHSLGAVVASELLFNSGESKVNTPAQSIVNTCFIAPAIGSESFQNYQNRPTSYNFQEEDNYNIVILYNTNDFVLEKTYEFGKFRKSFLPTEFGNTSLGCNHDADVDKLAQMFEEEFNASQHLYLFDLSLGNGGSPMRCHHAGCYSRHEKFDQVLEIFDDN